MFKQYKYIGQDPNKKGWIAKEKTANYYIENTQDILPKYMVENEPTLRQELKEKDVFENICYDLVKRGWSMMSKDKEMLKELIQKHLGITREEVLGLKEKDSSMINSTLMINLIYDKGLLID